MRILIVDDHEQNRYQLDVLLRASGHEVVLASNGAEALEAARGRPPDVIVSDILMPVMDGFALCRAWRADDRLRSVPFVFYTATYTDGRDRDFALSLGADRFLVKPEDPEVFLQTVAEVVRDVRSAPPHAPADAPPPPDESAFLQQYNAALVRKLEAKMQELEQDIAARRAAEAGMRLRDRALQAAANAIVITDPAGDILWANPAFTELTGYTLDEARGRNPRFLKSGVQGPEFYAAMWRTILDGHVWKGEIVNRYKDGHLYTEEATITPVLENDGRIAHFIAVKQDVTARRRAEAALRESETRFLHVTEHVGEWVWEVDAEGLYTYASPVVEKVLGYRPEELVGRHHFYDLFPAAHREELRRLALDHFTSKIGRASCRERG